MLPLEFKPAHRVGDLLAQHLDALELEAEEKGGVGRVLGDHFARVYKRALPRELLVLMGHAAWSGMPEACLFCKPLGFNPSGEAGLRWLEPEVLPVTAVALPGWNKKT